jgi:hypothetical protein
VALDGREGEIQEFPYGGWADVRAMVDSKEGTMQTQWIPALGLAATIALSGYMAIQLSADVEQAGPSSSSPVIAPATP